MANDEVDRFRQDLAVIRKAMGLHPTIGREMLAFGCFMGAAALGLSALSLLIADDRIQVALFAAIAILGPLGIALRSRLAPDSPPEVTRQVMLSSCIYAVVWVAGSGYAMATIVGFALGGARLAGLYVVSLGFLLGFSVLLIRSALRSREQYYCLGLALSTTLAGMLFPLVDARVVFPLAHGIMAFGFLASVAIQSVQLRQAVSRHASD